METGNQMPFVRPVTLYAGKRVWLFKFCFGTVLSSLAAGGGKKKNHKSANCHIKSFHLASSVENDGTHCNIAKHCRLLRDTQIFNGLGKNQNWHKCAHKQEAMHCTAPWTTASARDPKLPRQTTVPRSSTCRTAGILSAPPHKTVRTWD